MNLKLVNGKVTSLELVKEINTFRKQEGNTTELGHNDLLKVIRDEFEEEISSGNISQSDYTTNRGKKYPMFLLTLSQSKQVLVRESKFVRKAIITYIEKLEEELRNKNSIKLPTTYLEALEQLVEKEKKIIEMTPKVEYHDNVLDTDSEITTTVIAKELGMSAVSLNKILEENRIQYKQGKVWVLYKQYQNEGYTKIRTTLVDDKTFHSSVWTEKGREFIHGVVKHLNKYV